jgi:5'-methylthioadenosine phosphorylase
MVMTETAEIGIIGGTGVYDQENFEIIPRHGRNHTIPPHRVNYRANVWALKQLGVKRVIASSAVGSLREDYEPGNFVIPDQLIDRTKKRLDTFYEGEQTCHISFAYPFCQQLRLFFIEFAQGLGLNVKTNGTYVCIEGPRFSTKAESKLFRMWKADIIGMTIYPECVLAREAELCYVPISMVTDYDVWAEKPVSTKEVVETIQQSNENFKKLILEAIPQIPKERDCECGSALKDALI